MMRFISLASIIVLVGAPLLMRAQTLPFVESPTTTARRYLDQLLQTLTSPSSVVAPNALAPIPTQETDVIDLLESLLQKPMPIYDSPPALPALPAQAGQASTSSAANQELITILLAQVAALQAQIDALVAAQSATSTATSPDTTSGETAPIACPVIERVLAYGMSGTDVANLQLFLIETGYLAAGNATGFFGALTQAAVQGWQTAQEIVTSGSPEETGWGVVGPKTRAALQHCK